MAAAPPPVLHVLAGPNGAGKSSLYEAEVSHLAEAEFVNADRLVLQALGHHALTQAEAELGQRLAEARRAELMAAGHSLVTDFTFSIVEAGTHPRCEGRRLSRGRLPGERRQR